MSPNKTVQMEPSYSAGNLTVAEPFVFVWSYVVHPHRFVIGILIVLLLTTWALAQTTTQPARNVTDAGVITTGQAISPAGVQSVFAGRTYGVSFGETSDEIWVLSANSVFRLSWTENRVLGRFPFEGRPGLQSIQY